MPAYTVTAEATGQATVTVQAANEDEAITIAYRDHLTGIAIDGGEASWDIVDVEEA